MLMTPHNPGLFLGYRHLRLMMRRVRDAARELKPKLIIWGESGSGWMAARNLSAHPGRRLAGGKNTWIFRVRSVS